MTVKSSAQLENNKNCEDMPLTLLLKVVNRDHDNNDFDKLPQTGV